MTHRYFMTFIGLGLLSALHWGGAGGCGGSGGGGPAATGTTAASQGAVSGVTTGLSSALQAAVGGGGGAPALRLKSMEGDGENTSCTEAEDGSFECDDLDDSDGEGHVGCDFEDEGTEEECGEGSSLFTFNTDFTETFTDFSAGDECGQEVILNGTVTGHIEGTFSECDDAFSLSGSLQTSGLTVTLEDGSTHTVTFDITFTVVDDVVAISGEFCVDGSCTSGDPLDLETTECDEAEDEDCMEECLADCTSGDESGDDDESALEEDEGDESDGDDESCEAECESECADEPDCDSEDGEGCADSCEIAECSTDADGDGPNTSPDDFHCQGVAADAYAAGDPICEGDSVSCMTCEEGCCVVSE